MPNIKKDGSWSLRHRGVYTPGHPEPYELSRGRIENFLKCKGLFWLEQVKGVKQPKTPSFTMNTTTDVLLKRDADQVRGRATLPLWESHGLGHMIPYEHEHLENWTNSLHFGLNDTFFNYVHEPTNIKIGGGIDDMFLNTQTGQIHIVDYKSEAQGADWPDSTEIKPSSLDAPHKISYKHQMDIYVWVARKRGMDVSDLGYFVYVNAWHKDRKGMLIDDDPSKAWMEFATNIIPYEADTSWVEPTLFEIKNFLENQKACPEFTTKPTENAPYGSENGRFLMEALNILNDPTNKPEWAHKR